MNSENRKLNTCHVITRMIVGGAQENTLLTIKGHLENGHGAVLVTGPSPGREGELLKNVDMPEFEIKVFPDLVRELSVIHDFMAFIRLRRFFKERKFDVVHTHSSKAGIIGRLAAWSAGIPVVVHTVHGQAFHPNEKAWKNALYIFLERFAAKYCHRIYAVAQAMIDQCVDAKVAPREKYQVVYSGMDTARFSSCKRDFELRKSLGIPENVRVVATVARLFPLKGYEYVIPAAIRVISECPDTHFLLIGDGPMYDQLKKQLEDAGIADHFHFSGLVAPDRVADYLAQADLLWHLSLREGLPRAVVQALAVGIPAIGFALDGTPEVVINGETGYTVPAEDVDGVVEKSLLIFNDPGLASRMGENGKRKVVAQFDWHRMADILEAEYIRLAKENIPDWR
jgi:glycosyltransferase involved in cell wall biosynthesis